MIAHQRMYACSSMDRCSALKVSEAKPVLSIPTCMTLCELLDLRDVMQNPYPSEEVFVVPHVILC